MPQLIHRCASEWARTEAAKRLDAAAGRAASDRASLRAAEDDLAGTVVERQAARERNGHEHGTDGVVTCPFKGLASFDLDDSGFFFGRERLVADRLEDEDPAWSPDGEQIASLGISTASPTMKWSTSTSSR